MAILALLDCDSRAYEIAIWWLCPSVVCRPYVEWNVWREFLSNFSLSPFVHPPTLRPSSVCIRVAIFLNCIKQISFKFGLLHALSHTPRLFKF